MKGVGVRLLTTHCLELGRRKGVLRPVPSFLPGPLRLDHQAPTGSSPPPPERRQTLSRWAQRPGGAPSERDFLSNRLIAEDKEGGLFTVTLFRKVIDDFKTKAKENK